MCIRDRDDRFLIIVGPCSADNETAVMDYLHRLVPIQEQIKDKCIIIPRIYTNKPRTTGEGYKGMVQDVYKRQLLPHIPLRQTSV